MAKTVSDDIMVDVQSEANAPPFTITFQEPASLNLKKGWPVFIDGNGYIADIGSNTPSAIMGILAEDTHNDSVAGTHQCAVYIANGINVFAANVKQGSLADHVLVQADIGKPMGIQRDTSNNRVFLDSSVIAGASVRVFTLGLAQNTDVGDTNGRLRFLWLPKWAQTLSSS